MPTKKSEKDPKVVCLRVNTTSYGVDAEYLIAKVEKKANSYILKDMLRALLILKAEEIYPKNSQGQTVKQIVNQDTWDFRIDNYFTDHEAELTRSNTIYSREVAPDENLYESYMNAIDSHRQVQAQIEAQKLLAKKQAEIASAKQNRVQRRKKVKGSKQKTH
jgi:hypothetical protein